MIRLRAIGDSSERTAATLSDFEQGRYLQAIRTEAAHMARWLRFGTSLALIAQLSFPISGTAADPPKILKFYVRSRRYIVEGKGLGRVEIWVVPTGTGITDKEHQKVGLARRGAVTADGTATWSLDVGECPLATSIYARAYDTAGKRVQATRGNPNGGDVSLDATGASEISDKVCEGR